MKAFTIHSYGMERKDFKSRLFRKKIKKADNDYWFYLCAELLYRIKENEDLNCLCGSCLSEKTHFKYLISQMEKEGHIKPKPLLNFTGKGDCGRRLDPRA